MNANTQLRHSMTSAVFETMLPTLAPGEVMVYHVGSLMRDRKLDNVLGMEAKRVDEVATAAWAAYERGEVELVQRKLAPLKFEYLAIRRRDAAKVRKH